MTQERYSEAEDTIKPYIEKSQDEGKSKSQPSTPTVMPAMNDAQRSTVSDTPLKERTLDTMK